MGESALDLSEIVGPYKEDARQMIAKMREDLARWDDALQGVKAREHLKRMAHQLRGSGRTYGFRSVTRVGKAMENIVLKIENHTVSNDSRAREALRVRIDRLASIFKG